MEIIKSAKDVKLGEYVYLGREWRGPVNMVEFNFACDSLLIHYSHGTYELEFPDTYVRTTTEMPKKS